MKSCHLQQHGWTYGVSEVSQAEYDITYRGIRLSKKDTNELFTKQK